jgi:DNA polymerase-1
VACLARDTYLRDVLSDPTRDIHGEVATRFFGQGWTKEDRVRAKAVVFGLVYGREAYSISQDFGIPETEAQRYLNEFFQLIPDVVQWRKQVMAQVMALKPLESPFGRKRRFHLITRENKKDIMNEALGFLPQSTASDICMLAAGRLLDTFSELEEDLRPDPGLSRPAMRIFVHDSILVECREDMKDHVAAIMKAVMEDTAREEFDDWIPFFVDVEFGRSWGELEDV